MADWSWEGKRVLVTGADGFIGSHLTEALLGIGAKTSVLVRGTSLTGTVRHKFKNVPEEAVRNLDQVLYGDIASADVIDRIYHLEPQVILHLAAMAYTPFSFDHPLEVHAANVTGTLHVLEAVRRLKTVERVVCTSSSEVYGTAMTESISESHPLNPTSPYAASKAAADRYCHSYIQTYGMPVAIIRPFNTYGPRHTYDVIPRFIRMALKDEPITIYGTGEQTRDFMYVSDTVNAFLTMASREEAAGNVVNFGTGKDVSIKKIAHLINEISGSRSEITHIETRAAEVQRLCCDYSKARALFSWAPEVGIEEGLRRNIDWAREHWM